MGVSAEQNLQLKLIDKIIPEPLGGAHRDFEQMAATLKTELAESLAELQNMPTAQLLQARYERLMSYGFSV